MQRNIKTCLQCGAALIPDLDAKKDGTEEWDGHIFKFSCECANPNLRIAIG